jgi:hypothetical protein
MGCGGHKDIRRVPARRLGVRMSGLDSRRWGRRQGNIGWVGCMSGAPTSVFSVLNDYKEMT